MFHSKPFIPVCQTDSADELDCHHRTPEGLSVVVFFFFLPIQLASGAFGHIKDTVLSALNREPTMDISPETVGTLSLIMLAQAQEVFFLKATSGTRRNESRVLSGLLHHDLHTFKGTRKCLCSDFLTDDWYHVAPWSIYNCSLSLIP